MPQARDIKEYSSQELKEVLLAHNFPAFHARQILSWIYKQGSLSFSSMSNIPLRLQDFLKTRFNISSSKIKDTLISKDGTRKFAIELIDSNLIEAVYIPTGERNTLCISSQVGCKFGCSFCASTHCKWVRNLTCAEILDQVLLTRAGVPDAKISHVVFMGIGEPFDNFENVLKAARIINSPEGFCLGKRRITISTCGIIPGIKKLAKEDFPIELSVSLHACDDDARSKIMPVNKVYPLKDLAKALFDYQKNTGRQITFEYVLIKNFNTGKNCAAKLKRLFGALDYKLNLILFNPVEPCGFEPAGQDEITGFQDALKDAFIRSTLRKPRGQDILAACGQLRVKLLNREEA